MLIDEDRELLRNGYRDAVIIRLARRNEFAAPEVILEEVDMFLTRHKVDTCKAMVSDLDLELFDISERGGARRLLSKLAGFDNQDMVYCLWALHEMKEEKK